MIWSIYDTNDHWYVPFMGIQKPAFISSFLTYHRHVDNTNTILVIHQERGKENWVIRIRISLPSNEAINKLSNDICNLPLENTEGAIKTGHFSEAVNIWQTRRRQRTQKHNTIWVGHHYTQTKTYNVNKTWALLQTTGCRDEPNIGFMPKS